VLIAACVLLGLVVGSFLNVVVWRVPRGESVVRPPSHCPNCDAPVRPRDNIPVLSWLLLRGRCRDCSTRISGRYPAVEAGTAVIFALLAWKIGTDWVLPAFLYLGAVGLALALIDLDVRRLPNVLTLPSYVVGAVLLTAASALSGSWGALGRAAIGMAALYAFYFLLAIIKPGGMGFGDVKLAGVLGMYLAYLGWGVLIVGAFLGFLLGGVGGILLMIFRKAGRKSTIPFGPYMLAGALLAILFGASLAKAYTDLSLG
jgi:leader peptidase (prepilin peptidase)/N-methyltransferase